MDPRRANGSEPKSASGSRVGLLRATIVGWCTGQAFQQAAALAFYAAFALAPTLVIVVTVAGWIFGQDAAAGQLAASLEAALGPIVSDALAETLAYQYIAGTGWSATGVAVGLMIFAATGLFIQLQTALNAVWSLPPPPGNPIWRLVRNRLSAFLMLLGLGVLLLLLLFAHAVLATMRAALPDEAWARDARFWQLVNWGLLFVLLNLLFAMIYRLLPDVPLRWIDVWLGSAITAVLFLLGNYLIGVFLGRMSPTIGYRAASYLMIVMLWVYYSSQALLFGAELTKNISLRRHSGQVVTPTP
jgi:membrane protein